MKFKMYVTPLTYILNLCLMQGTFPTSLKVLQLFLFINLAKRITSGRIEEWDAMKPLCWRSVNSRDAGWPRLRHRHRGGWNEMNLIGWDVCVEIVEWNFWQRKTELTARNTYPDFFSSTLNSHGVTEKPTRDPSGGRRATNLLRHRATLVTYIFRKS